jgi:hypothetical protein
MAHAVAAASTDERRNLALVRAWWRLRHPPTTIWQRLDVLYTGAITAAILGSLVYGTMSSAAAEVVTPHWLVVFGPSLAMLSLLVAAHWGAYQGPAVFSVPDVFHLLGAPLSRRALAARRLVLVAVGGALVGALAAATLCVGLAGEGRGIPVIRAAGLIVGLAELGMLAVAATWAVQRSARWERAVMRAPWAAIALAAALAAGADAGRVGRALAAWSGLWGWAVLPGTAVGDGERFAALGLLTVAAVAATVAMVRDSGGCPTERHLRRAEGRQSAVASLASFDARTARQSLEAVAAGTSQIPPARLSRLRNAIARRGARASTPALAIAWRDAVSAARTPGRIFEAAGLAAAGSVLSLLNADRLMTIAAAMILVYIGASRMLGPLRAELDDTDRLRTMLRPRAGHVLAAHTLVPLLVTTTAAVLAAIGCAVLGGLPEFGTGAGLAAVWAAPAITWCAAMSARRRGRAPQTLVMTATAVDPSGGGLAILSWLAYWPAAAAVVGGVPIALVSAAGTEAAPFAAIWIACATAGLGYLVRREPVEV